jgi:hypothetical protein
MEIYAATQARNPQKPDWIRSLMRRWQAKVSGIFPGITGWRHNFGIHHTHITWSPLSPMTAGPISVLPSIEVIPVQRKRLKSLALVSRNVLH